MLPPLFALVCCLLFPFSCFSLLSAYGAHRGVQECRWNIIQRTETHFKFPAGSVTNALATLIALKNHGTLPGFASADRASATLTSTSFTGQTPGMCPFVLTWYVQKAGEPSWYAYTLAQPSEGETWRLQQAQRISSDYRVTEDLPLPRSAP